MGITSEEGLGYKFFTGHSMTVSLKSLRLYGPIGEEDIMIIVRQDKLNIRI
jgi:hypothetical protein